MHPKPQRPARLSRDRRPRLALGLGLAVRCWVIDRAMMRSGELERLRSTEVKALRELDAVFAQQIQRFAVLDTFGDRLLTEPVSDVDDRLDEVLVRCVGDEIA